MNLMNASRRFWTLAPGLLLLMGLGLGLWTVRDYGESWDEHIRQRYAERSLAAYRGQLRALQDEKGPFYVMLAWLGANAAQRLLPGWQWIETWHLMHFLAFLLGMVFFHRLARRWLSPPAALGATVLFATQPLVWGHAFINPKDIPFLTFFMGSVTLGLDVFDRLPAPAAPDWPALAAAWKQDLQPGNRRRLATALTLDMLLLLGLLLLLLGQDWFKGRLSELVALGYAAPPASLAARLFDLLADPQNRLPLENYINKALQRYPDLLGMLGLAAFGLGLLVSAWACPALRQAAGPGLLRPLAQASARLLRQRQPWLAALTLGAASAIRSLGPFSGLLVVLGGWQRAGRRALPAAALYLALAGLVTLLAWPGLWRAPISTYLAASSEASDFTWEGKVRFAGQDYAVGELPIHYLPTLVALQLSEPVLPLAGLGLVAGLLRLRRAPARWPVAGLLAAWLLLPPLAAVGLGSTLYDNFRHFLFVLPPLFLLAGLGLQTLFERLAGLARLTRLAQAALLILSLLPGLVALVELHPYQYIYYNQLVGGTAGAFRRFESDYWATSYREATNFLNATAPPGAAVVAWGPDHLVQRYARPDLLVLDYRRVREDLPAGPLYAVLSSRHDKDLSLFPGSTVVYRVERGGAILAVVKQVQQAGGGQP